MHVYMYVEEFEPVLDVAPLMVPFLKTKKNTDENAEFREVATSASRTEHSLPRQHPH